MFKKIIFLALFLSGLMLNASAKIEVDRADAINGKSVYVELKGEKYTVLKFMDKTYQIYKHPSKKDTYYAILPISYYAKAKNEKMFVHYKQNIKIRDVEVDIGIKKGDYKKETLKVQSSKVKLNKKDKKRASKEYKEAMKIYNTVNKKNYISSAFILPLDSAVTSEFGRARTYNGTLKGYHGGTDYRAKVGTPIKACNNGIVVLAKDRFYAGGSVIIDHGRGIYSCYYHLSKFKVKKGQRVRKGDIIALSGASGRITGPHLHFGFRVNGIQVDPLQLMALINKNIIGVTK